MNDRASKPVSGAHNLSAEAVAILIVAAGEFRGEIDDRVFDVVYCSNLKSRPSKTYAYPESRLGRIESEAADAGRQVTDRVVVTVLEKLFERAATDDDGAVTVLERYATDVGYADEAAEARELAEIDRLVGGEV